MALFHSWFMDAKSSEPNDPNAMYLTTADATGLPNVRVVLMKDCDETGFVFYTNTESAKGVELLSCGHAAICFDWKSMQRRVVIRGSVAMVADHEADAYYASRARQSRLGAWASHQSRPLKSKITLLKEVARLALKYRTGPIPRPAHWTGFRLAPTSMNFQDGGYQSVGNDHVFTRQHAHTAWKLQS